MNKRQQEICSAVMGPDGSGKSSVIDGVQRRLESDGRTIHYIHLRPRLGRNTDQNAAPVTNPHAKAPYGQVLSTLKIFYLLADYCGGYILKVRPLLKRSEIVIFDRYYHDLLVDPKRYRYGGPMWLARLVGRLVPKPDLWILLDAPAEVLQSRKQEVPFEETARQRQAYLDLVKGFKNSVVIDASQPLDDVVADTNRAILEFMAKRTEKRLARYIR